MAIKNLIYELLPFVCFGSPVEEFYRKIDGTGSKNFFRKVFDKISESKANGDNVCAFFGMNGGIMNSDLSSLVFAYQVRRFHFAFWAEDVETVFKIQGASEGCALSDSYILEDKRSVTIHDIARHICEIFTKYNSIDRYEVELAAADKSRLGALIADWVKVIIQHTENNDEIPKCRALSTTYKYRLLYKMSNEDQEKLVLEVLKKQPNEENSSDFPAIYEEQKALVAALKDVGVARLVISTVPKGYLDAIIKHFELDIELEAVFGSHLILRFSPGGVVDGMDSAKEKTTEEIIDSQPCKAYYASGDIMVDYALLVHIIMLQGFVLFRQQLPLPVDLTCFSNSPSVHIQNVELNVAKWKNERHHTRKR